MNQKSEYDVVVVGGGFSGVAAAVAAARENLRVLLIERNGYLGGMATCALVNPFMSYRIYTARWGHDEQSEIVNKGIFLTVLEQLDALGGLYGDKTTFNEEILKLIFDRMTKESGVQVLFHTSLIGAQTDGKKVQSIQVVNRSGMRSITADYFIDASGNADLSYLAGCRYQLGREEDGFCQPMTLCFRLGNVDTATFHKPEIQELMSRKYEEMQKNGKIKNPRENILTFPHVCDGVVHFNSTRIVKKSPVDAQEYSESEMVAREQVYELYLFMKENVPGFEKCTLLMSAPELGIRESRRIVGMYTITQEDLLSATKFEDSVARGTYPVDIHNPSGTGTVLKDIPYGDYYTIPYRALIPVGMDNLLACGRPISSTHEAHAAYRIMPICCCIGEGAGTAAAIAAKGKTRMQDVGSQALHTLLDQHGALY